MKRIMKFSLGVLLTLGLASQAWAVTIVGGTFDGTNVGFIDEYISETAAGNVSGDANLLTWVNDELNLVGDDAFTTVLKTEGVPWYNTDVTDVIAFQLQHGPGYYVIKNAQLAVLFRNLSDINWGVIDLNDILGNINLGDDFEISFVAEFGAAPVPEPGTLALLGAGLVLIGLTRRRRSKLVS